MAPATTNVGKKKARISASRSWCGTLHLADGASETEIRTYIEAFYGSQLQQNSGFLVMTVNLNNLNLFFSLFNLIFAHFLGAFVGQLELAPTTGQLHLQFAINFGNGQRVRPLSIRDEAGMPLFDPFGKPSYRSCNGNWASNVRYCTKVLTRKEGCIPITMGCSAPREPSVISLDKMYPWQKALLDRMLDEPDDRTIEWYWDADGNTGKTALCKYLCYHHDALLVGGSAADAKYAIIKWHETKGDYPRIVLMNVPRSAIHEGVVRVSYGGIESIKDGCFFSGKYESCMALTPNCHVVVFANCEPDEHELSADRWRIVPAGPSTIW